MIPVRSLRRLIQEDLYPDEFRVLLACLLLNRTRGDQVRPVLEVLLGRFPTVVSLADVPLDRSVPSSARDDLERILRPLGLLRRRVENVVGLARAYGDRPARDPRGLPGVGTYALDCWRILFLEELDDVPPDDGPLTDYWIAAKAGLWPEEGWPVDPVVVSRRAYFRGGRDLWRSWDRGREEWIDVAEDVRHDVQELARGWEFLHRKNVGPDGGSLYVYRGPLGYLFGQFVEPGGGRPSAERGGLEEESVPPRRPRPRRAVRGRPRTKGER